VHAEHSWDLEELLALPPKARAVLYLRIIEGRPFGEIAELLGCSRVAARATASRATKRLRVLMSEEVRHGTA
jgi:RNA polymerase sigma factor (sigma-70 family)